MVPSRKGVTPLLEVVFVIIAAIIRVCYWAIGVMLISMEYLRDTQLSVRERAFFEKRQLLTVDFFCSTSHD